jgi:hypothetical protein
MQSGAEKEEGSGSVTDYNRSVSRTPKSKGTEKIRIRNTTFE